VLLQANSHTANTSKEHASRPLPTQHTHTHTHIKKYSLYHWKRTQHTATHATMAIANLSNYILKLDANGSNFWKWNAAVLMYAVLNDVSSILERKPKPPTLC
jgi:hypothetical protein